MNITFTQASGLQDSVFGKYQNPIISFLERRGEEFEQTSLIKEMFCMKTSDTFGGTFTGMTAMESFEPVGELGAAPFTGFQEGYQKFIGQMTWRNAFAVSMEMVEDSILMNLSSYPEAFMTAYQRGREQFGAALYGGALQGNQQIQFGGRAFDVTVADGMPLFDTAHPAKVSGPDQSNRFSNPFSASVLGELETRMQQFRGDNGELLDVAPDTIVIPNIASLKNDVFAAIGADREPVSANNAFNYQYGRWNIIIWNYLRDYIPAGDEPWILLDSKFNDLYNGAVWIDRVQLKIDSTIDYNTMANVWYGRSRFNAGFNDWRFAAVGGVTGGDTL